MIILSHLYINILLLCLPSQNMPKTVDADCLGHCWTLNYTGVYNNVMLMEWAEGELHHWAYMSSSHAHMKKLLARLWPLIIPSIVSNLHFYRVDLVLEENTHLPGLKQCICKEWISTFPRCYLPSTAKYTWEHLYNSKQRPSTISGDWHNYFYPFVAGHTTTPKILNLFCSVGNSQRWGLNSIFWASCFHVNSHFSTWLDIGFTWRAFKNTVAWVLPSEISM